MKQIVISLYDFTGEALKPWAEAGYACYAFDIQHLDTKVEGYANGGFIRYEGLDLYDFNTHQDLFFRFNGHKVVFGMAESSN